MYVIKWTRDEDYLKHIKYQEAIWGSLKEAMPFESPEKATNYIINGLSGKNESDRQEYLWWLKNCTKILYIHPLNV